MKLRSKSNRKTRSFDPDVIATRLHQALKSDLSAITQAYDSESTPLGMLSHRLCSEFTKKYVNPSAKSDILRDRAFEKFRSVVDHLRGVPTLPDLAGFRSCQSKQMTELESVLYRARSLIHWVLGEFTEDEWFTATKHGPGSSVGIRFSEVSFEGKYTFPMTTTERVKPLFERYLNFDPVSRLAIDSFNGFRPLDEWYRIVDGSEATTVRKTAEIDRFICLEPTLNMFFQQGLMSMMYDRLAAVGLDVSRLPDRHRNLARTSSITGRNATIDWSSASDTELYELVKLLTPHKWFWALDICRCEKMDVGGEWVTLPMFSTMGNAVTFPLETLVFWALAEASTLHTLGGNTVWRSSSEFQCSVFGDDCILPCEAVPVFTRVLGRLGYILNDDKSFSDPNGRFRESCGGDFLAGYDVRPLHLKGPVSTRLSALEPWLYTILNRIQSKYILCFGPLTYVYDKTFFRELFSIMAEHGITLKFIPLFYPDDAGFKTPDLSRFLANYSFPVTRVDVNTHGEIRFKYCSFKYRQPKGEDRVCTDDMLRFAIALKRYTPIRPKYIQERKRGGYVVAVASTGCWSVQASPTRPLNTKAG